MKYPLNALCFWHSLEEQEKALPQEEITWEDCEVVCSLEIRPRSKPFFPFFLFLPSAHVCTGNKRNSVTQQWTHVSPKMGSSASFSSIPLQCTFYFMFATTGCTWVTTNTGVSISKQKEDCTKRGSTMFPILSLFSQGGGGVLGLIFCGYVPLASQSPYPIIVYYLATYKTHFSHFLENIIFTNPT